jgi:hypothetical protein
MSGVLVHVLVRELLLDGAGSALADRGRVVLASERPGHLLPDRQDRRACLKATAWFRLEPYNEARPHRQLGRG